MLYLLEQRIFANWDENIGLVIRARNSKEARKLANTNHANEGEIWTDCSRTSCNRIKEDNDSKIILISNSGA